MGLRGPQPKPTAIREIEGRYLDPAKRNEMRPEGKPVCPRWLPKEGKAEWRRITHSMPPDMLTKVNQSMLATWCNTWALYQQAAQHIAENGPTFEGQMGEQQTPWVAVHNAQAKILLQMSGRFGFSPSDRVGLTSNAVKVKSKFKDLLGQNGS